MTPLNVLLSHIVLDLTRDAERRDPKVNVVQWSDFWRVADGARAREVHLDARISRRAMKTYVNMQTKAGQAVLDGGVLRLTYAGLKVRDSAGAVVGAACRAGEDRFGPSPREALVALVGRLEFEYAHYLHPYGTADPTVTGGSAAGAEHGLDWKPVVRLRDHEATDGLSLLALLSQALMAFTAEYEAYGRGPLLWAVNMAEALDEPTPLAAVPSALAITGNGRSTMERHAFVTVSDGLARLTPAGEAVKRSYEQLVAEIESSWRARYRTDVVGSLRSALESADALLTVAHADHPIVNHVSGVGFAEVSGSLSTGTWRKGPDRQPRTGVLSKRSGRIP